MTKGLLIAFIIVTTIYITNANYSCFNSLENQLACKAASAISLLPPSRRERALIKSNALLGMVSNLGNSVVQVLIRYLSECPIDTTNDKTLAKSFHFRLYYPNKQQINLNGLEFMNLCTKSATDENKSVDEIVYLWHGILSECPSASASDVEVSHTFSDETAFAIAKNLNALVVLIDWGKSGLSCCNYLELTFCYLDTITDWITNQVINCAKNGVTPSIEKTTFVGHSMGAQYSGYTSQKVFNKTGKKFKKCLGLDPASPFFSNDSGIGQCQGIKPDVAEYTMTIQTGIGGLGTSKIDLAMVNVVSNKTENCQNGDKIHNLIGNHSYAVDPIFNLLAKDITLTAIDLSQPNQAMSKVSFYENIKIGTYVIETKHNQALLNAN